MSTPASDRFLGFVNALQLFVGRELSSAETLILASIFPSLATRDSTGADAVALAAKAMSARQQQSGKPPQGEVILADILDQVASLEQLRASSTGQTTPLPMAQLAERLITLIKAEVENCFTERFAPLNEQMAEAVRQLHTLLQQHTAPPKTEPDPKDQEQQDNKDSPKITDKTEKNAVADAAEENVSNNSNSKTAEPEVAEEKTATVLSSGSKTT